MKKLIIIILLSWAVVPAFAQSNTTAFTVDGINVIMKPTVKDIINISVYYRGGVTNYDAGKAGIENLALSGAPECGTEKYSKDAFKDKADKYGVDINGYSTYDYGKISLNCIKKYFDEGWDLLSQAVVAPVYNEKDLGLLKQKVIANIRNEEADPDSKVENMATDSTFKGTAYATSPIGEEPIVDSLTAAEVKAYYYNTDLNKNKMFIIVVGNISRDEITDKIHKDFASLPSKPYDPPAYDEPELSSNTLAVMPRELATNYIIGVVGAPALTADDYAASRLAISTLSQNLFKEIRTKRNLSYAPYATAVLRKMPFDYVYVSTTDPKAAVQAMTDEIKRLKKEGFSQKEFNGTKNLFITGNYMKEESTDAMASSLGLAEILGDYKMSDEFVDQIQHTSVEQVNDAFRKYINGIHWNYLGSEKAAQDASEAFNISVQ